VFKLAARQIPTVKSTHCINVLKRLLRWNFKINLMLISRKTI